MLKGSVQYNELQSFKLANLLLNNNYTKPASTVTFGEVLDKAKEVSEKVKEEATSSAEEPKESKKKKLSDNKYQDLPNISQIIQNQDHRNSNDALNSYLFLKQFRFHRKPEEDLSRSMRQQVLQNATHAASQPLVQPIQDQRFAKKPSRSQLLEFWERYAPYVTEDITKKSVRIDIPLLNDVQALVLRLHPDKSVTATILGSEVIAKLVKENKDKLDKNLRHHHLSLREFNVYHSQLTFDSESGTKKQKRKQDPNKRKVDLI